MPHDPTPITGVVTTSAETATGTAAEPSLTLTQLHALLREASAYERAKRPLVIHHRADPDTVAAAPAPHPGINVTIPAPGAALVPAPLRRPARAGWGVRLVYASMATLLTGAGDGVLAGTAPLPVVLCAAGILGAIGGTARALTEERQAQS